MNEIVDQALPLWGLTDAPYKLVAERENAVFRVEGPDGSVAVRLHRKRYRNDAELRSELQWMAAVDQGGIRVPTPIAAEDDSLFHIITGTQVDVLTWLSGSPVEDALANRSHDGRARLFGELGRAMARLHDICDQWTPPYGFTRCAWDAEGLLGDNPLWGRFWDNPALRSEDRTLSLAFRDYARSELVRLKHDLDYGLIHADFVSANVIVEGDTLAMIDFDDGGFGYRLFDLATALLKLHDAPDYTALREALLEGYRSARLLDDRHLDLFLALRATTYVGWNIARVDEAGGAARNTRFIDTARTMLRAYMDDADRSGLNL